MSFDNAALTVYGDSISGNCLKVQFVCDLLGIPYQWIEISVLAKETRTPEFLSLNPWGEVPVMKLADGRILVQSNAIILHLAQGSDLVPADSFDRALMFQWLFWEQYSHEPTIAVRRFHKFFLKRPDSAIDPTLLSRGEKALNLMNAHLALQNYFVSNRLSLADIALVAYTRFAHEGGFGLPAHVKSWVYRVEDDLKIAHAC